MNTPASTLSRRLQKLEAHLGCKLLNRSPRGIILTREGENYLNKHPKIRHPNDLLKHHWLVAQPLSKIVLTNQQSDEIVKLNISTARFQINEISLCIALAKQHLGLTYVPKVLCQTELKNGQLINILPRWQMPKRDIYALYGAQK